MKFQTISGQTVTGPLDPRYTSPPPSDYSRLTNSNNPVSVGQLCGNLGQYATTPYVVGGYYPELGGYIGYLDQTGVHGIVVAKGPGLGYNRFEANLPWCVGYSNSITGAVNNSDVFSPTSSKVLLYNISSQFLSLKPYGATSFLPRQNKLDYGYYTAGRMNTKILCEKTNGGYWTNYANKYPSSIITYAFNLCFNPSYNYSTNDLIFSNSTQVSFYDWYIPAAKEIQMVYVNCQNNNVDSQTLESMFGVETPTRPLASSTEASNTTYYGYTPDATKETQGSIAPYLKEDATQFIRICIFRCF